MNISRFRESGESIEKNSKIVSKEKTTSSYYENSDYGYNKQINSNTTGNNFYNSSNVNKNNNNKNTHILNRQSSFNNPNEKDYNNSNNEINNLEKNKFTNNNLSPILATKNNNLINTNNNNNSNPISPKINTNQDSRDEIKEFLLKVKEKIPTKDFKEFISDIKLLTDKNNICNKKEIINHVNTIFQNHRDLYMRFEEILLIKKY